MANSKKKNPKKGSCSTTNIASNLEFKSRDERIAAGKQRRDKVSRTSHAGWTPPAKRRDPIDIPEESNRDRVPELVPIRYGRMLRSPFTFLRGSAGLMAYDLANTPNTGLRVKSLWRLPFAQLWFVCHARAQSGV